MSPLEQHLRVMADMIAKITPEPGRRYILADFVLRHANVRGRMGAELPLFKGPAKECFSNAYKLATRMEGLRYCEGYAMHDEICVPILHAWVVDTKGAIIDNTLEYPERYQYCGIRFSTRELLRETNRTGYYGMLDSGRGFNIKLMDRMDKKARTRAADLLNTQNTGI